ncbi:MAG: nonstructural protein [Microvirus sp.]|nr:MAG: nonstructural protein [Microvirus sp.]
MVTTRGKIENFDVAVAKEKFAPNFQGTKKLYAVKDKKEGIMEVFIQPNDLVAMRNFSQIAKDKNVMVGKFPEDFQLLKLGEIASESGELTSGVKVLAEAADYIAND